MRRHWMAIPITAVTPFMVLAIVLWKTEQWSNGALGCVLLGLMSIACVVGMFMAPIGPDGTIEREPRRPSRRG